MRMETRGQTRREKKGEWKYFGNKWEREWEKGKSKFMLMKVDCILSCFPIVCCSVDSRLLSLYHCNLQYYITNLNLCLSVLHLLNSIQGMHVCECFLQTWNCGRCQTCSAGKERSVLSWKEWNESIHTVGNRYWPSNYKVINDIKWGLQGAIAS